MNHDEVIKEFRDAGALLEGHFILNSGLRSSVFLQKVFVFMEPARTERLCKALAQKITENFGLIDMVVSPAVGGIIPGYETARHLAGAKSVFLERENDGFVLRRGFEIPDGARVVIVEDIVTTGLSIQKVVTTIRATKANLVGAACLIDRSGGKTKLGVPLIALAQLDIPNYRPDELPPELAAIPPVKPGSPAQAA
jgi:orotate phosphoribosyltransferase